MDKKCGLFYWFSLYLFIMSPQEMRAAGIHSGYVVITQPVIAGLGMAATVLTTIAQNAYQKYLENSKKEDEQYCCSMQRKEELEKIKQELVRIRNDLQAIKGLDSESFTYQFLKYYSDEQFNGLSLPFIDQEKCLSEYELMLLEKQKSDMCFVLISHLNQLIENVDWIQVLYNDSMVEINRMIEIWSNKSHALTAEDIFKVYSHYLLWEYLIAKMERAFDEVLIVSRYYGSCRNEHIKSVITVLTTLQQIIPVVEGKKSWVLAQKRLARNNSATLEGYFVSRNISVVAFKNATQKEFGEEFKKRDAEILKKAVTEQQAHSGFGGGPKKDDDEERPFGKYEDAPYHTKVSNSVKRKAPSNGQQALDNSVAIGKNTPRRIGISDKEIVVLDQTSPRLFHGHVRLWKELTQEMKNALVDAGLCTLKGKIK